MTETRESANDNQMDPSMILMINMAKVIIFQAGWLVVFGLDLT